MRRSSARLAEVAAPALRAVLSSAPQAAEKAFKKKSRVAAAQLKASDAGASTYKRSKAEGKVLNSAGSESAREARSYEAKWWQEGIVRVAGVDEAGRGPLAGPVVAAACVIPATVHIDGIGDSKALSHEQREMLYEALTSHPQVEWAVCTIDHTTIDDINILQATMRAMEGAVAGLPNGADRVLVDGPKVPAALLAKGEPLVKGDSRSYVIGAASIIAKVTRDRMMVAFHERWPVYGFEQHKGYGTAQHMALIHEHGPCEIHRRSFQPVKGLVEQSLAQQGTAAGAKKGSAGVAAKAQKPAAAGRERKRKALDR